MRLFKSVKKVMSLILVMVLLMSMAGSSVLAATEFKDVKSNDWFKSDLEYILSDSRKILSGYPDGSYKPAGTLQVDQFLKCVIVATGHTVANVEGYWAQGYIDKAIEVGYIGGTDYSDYTKGITRAEMASIVTKVMEDLESVTYEQLEDIEKNLSDSNSVAIKHRSNVMKVYELGIITGYPDGTFKPSNTLTRAEATVVLRRIIDASARKPYVAVEDAYASHYKGGGEDWVDPVVADDAENIAIDTGMIESEKLWYDDRGKLNDKDRLSVNISYDENEYPTKQLEDLERLLRRRLNEDNSNVILDYLSVKTGWYELLSESHKTFELEEYNIIIEDRRIGEWLGAEMSKKSRNSSVV